MQQVPNVVGCSSATFTPDDSKLVMVCGQKVMAGMPFDHPELFTHPTWALITTVDLDGGNWEIRVPMFPAGWSPESWPHHLFGVGWFGARKAYILEDGTVALEWSSKGNSHLMTWKPGAVEGTILASPTSGWWAVAEIVPEGIAMEWCEGCYAQTREDIRARLVLIDSDGVVLQDVHTWPDNQHLSPRSMPRQDRFILQEVDTNTWPVRDIGIFDTQTGTTQQIARGYNASWQPPVDSAADNGDLVPSSLPTGTILFTGTANRMPYLMELDLATQEISYLYAPASGSGAWGGKYSHSGDRIAFVSGESGVGDAWIMNADGTGVYQASSFDATEWVEALDWSADDSALFLSLYNTDRQQRIVRLDLATGEITDFVDSPGAIVATNALGDVYFGTAVWEQGEIYATDESGSDPVLIGTGRYPTAANQKSAAVWEVHDPANDARLLKMYRDGEVFDLPGSGFVDSGPALSPDAEYVVWSVDQSPSDNLIYIGTTKPADQGGQVLLTIPMSPHEFQRAWWFDWKPNGIEEGMIEADD